MSQQQHLPVFPRWRCIEHDCGSYSFSNLSNHQIDSCIILREETVGVVRPKTWGGFNGNVSRHYMKEWINECRNKQMEENKILQWILYRKKMIKRKYINKYKNANRYQRVQKNQGKESKRR